MASTGSIVVTRDKAPWRDQARKHKLLIDDSVVGRLAQGESFTQAVHPGTQSVQMNIDWASSPKIHCSVEAGRAVQLVCCPGGPAFSVWTLLRLFRPGSYVRLEVRSGQPEGPAR